MSMAYPRTILRYISSEFVWAFLITLTIVTSVWVLASGITVIRHQWLGPQAFLAALPAVTVISLKYTLPMAVLFGASVSYGRMSSDNEIRAMEWNGIHIGWVVFPAALIALGASAASLILNCSVIPSAHRHLGRIVRSNVMDIMDRQLTRASQGQARIVIGRVALDVKGYDRQTKTMTGITIYYTKPDDGTLLLRIDAARAVIVPGKLAGAYTIVPDENQPEQKRHFVTLQFEGGSVTQFDPETTRVVNRYTAPPVALDLSSQENGSPEVKAMYTGQLAKYARTAEQASRRREARTSLYERFALGVSPLFFVLLAAPMASLVRWKHVLTSFLPSLGVVLVIYYPLVATAKVWGDEGRLDPAIGLFAGNFALLLIAGVIITLILRR